jgi:polyhydroxybutyrate depolymerase
MVLSVRAGLMAVSIVFWSLSSGCQNDPPVELGKYAYERTPTAANCAPETREGQAGITDDQRSAKGIAYNVRTPANYDPTVAHPLLMVYAPAGINQFRNEGFTGLTQEATQAGFIVGYANRQRLSIKVIEELGTIPNLIADKWCVDTERIFLTGHSDGGTVSVALAVLEQTQHIPAAIAPSAAGFTAEDLAGFTCPAPLSVMIMHSHEDQHFPGYGQQIADWWAACNGCAGESNKRQIDGCQSYPNCASDVTTLYCEGTGSHLEWPAFNTKLRAFFVSVR